MHPAEADQEQACALAKSWLSVREQERENHGRSERDQFDFELKILSSPFCIPEAALRDGEQEEEGIWRGECEPKFNVSCFEIE